MAVLRPGCDYRSGAEPNGGNGFLPTASDGSQPTTVIGPRPNADVRASRTIKKAVVEFALVERLPWVGKERSIFSTAVIRYRQI